MSLYTAIIFIFVFTIFIVGIYQKNSNAICRSKKMLDGKTVIVTGGTSGLGLEIATDFAKRGARVIVACPFVEEGIQGRKRIIDITGNEDVIFKVLDLSSLESVRNFAKDINQTEKRLDVLINNAGVGAVDDFVTKDGMSFIMQVNYFGHFLLTLLLLPLLKRSATPVEPARVINTSSVFHFVGSTNFDKINSPKYWYLTQAYANSKLCLALFSYNLAKKLQDTGVVVNTVDPGLVGTAIYHCVGIPGRILSFFIYVLFKTPREGAQTALYVALDEKAGRVSGQYFRNCNLIKARALVYDDKIANKLWNLSINLVGLNGDHVNQIPNTGNTI